MQEEDINDLKKLKFAFPIWPYGVQQIYEQHTKIGGQLFRKSIVELQKRPECSKTINLFVKDVNDRAIKATDPIYVARFNGFWERYMDAPMPVDSTLTKVAKPTKNKSKKVSSDEDVDDKPVKKRAVEPVKKGVKKAPSDDESPVKKTKGKKAQSSDDDSAPVKKRTKGKKVQSSDDESIHSSEESPVKRPAKRPVKVAKKAADEDSDFEL